MRTRKYLSTVLMMLPLLLLLAMIYAPSDDNIIILDAIPINAPLSVSPRSITVEMSIPTSKPTPKPKPTVKPTPTIEPCPYDKDELDLLARLIMAEAGSDWCKDDMLAYVGSVVLNRMASDKYPDTMYKVIYQPGQYACVNNGHINKEPTERCWEIAEDLLVNGSVLPENVVYQAEFRQGKGVYCTVQNMYFCYD